MIDSFVLCLLCVINCILRSITTCVWKKFDTNDNSKQIELYVGIRGAKEPTVMTAMIVLLLSDTMKLAY